MTTTIIGISIAITIIACILRFAVWIFWPRKVDETDPLSEPHGDVVNAPRRSL